MMAELCNTSNMTAIDGEGCATSALATDASSNDTPTGTRYKAGYHTFLLFMALMIIIHNAVVIHIYANYRAIRTFSNLIVVNLSTTDLLTGLALIPSTVISATFSGKNNGFVFVYFTSNVISDYCTALTVIGLTLVIAERHYSFCWPFRHEQIMYFMQRGIRTKILIALIWISLFLLAVAPLSWNYNVLVFTATEKEITKTGLLNVIHSIFILSTCFLIPAVLMSYFLISMLLVTRRIRKNPNVFPRRRKDGSGRVTLLCLIMYISFLLCWSPMMVLRLLIDIEEEPEYISTALLQGLFAMRCATSLLNPIWYAWLKSEFRACLFQLKIMRKVWPRRKMPSRRASLAQDHKTCKETIWRETTL